MRVVKIIIFIALFIPFYIWLGNLYEDAQQHNRINRWNHQRFGDFYDLPENYLDLVFLGSSHSYCSFDPELFNKILGIRTYQMGMPLQHPDGTYYTLKEILRHQSPSIAVFEVYWGVLGPFHLQQAAELFEVLRSEDLVDDFIKNAFPVAERVKYNIPAIRFQQVFFAYRSSRILNYLDETFGLRRHIREIPGEERYKVGGFIYCTYVIPEERFTFANQYRNFDGRHWAMDGVQRDYIQLIIDLCKENNIEFLTVKTLDSSGESESYDKTRSFYQAMGFKPLEVFPMFWDEDNPCLFMVKTVI